MVIEILKNKTMGRGAALVAAGLLTVIGCGPGDTPATLQPGTGDNPLDGAVVSDDGNSLTFSLSEDGTSLDEVDIQTPDGAERVAFDDAADSGGVAVPREIETAAGNSFAFNRDTNSAQVMTTILSNSTTFNVDLEENPFGLNARGVKQDVGADDCPAIRNSVDQFCDYFRENAATAQEDLVAVATEIALEQVDDSLDPFVPGVVAGVIDDFFTTLGLVCAAWDDVRGVGTDAEVDPCEAL